MRTDATGPLVFVPTDARPRFEEVAPSRLKSLCGQQIDWLELPAEGQRN
jgi:hypothetical protein